MQKSLFPRYFSICIAVIFLSVTVLGLVFLSSASRNFDTEKFELLKRNVRQAELLTVANYKSNNFAMLDGNLLSGGYSILGQAVDADIFLADVDGRVFICSHTRSCVHTDLVLDPAVTERAKQDDFYELGRLGGAYDEIYYTAGSPVYSANGEMMGIVFASASGASQTRFIKKLVELYLISAAIVLGVSMVLMYFITRRWVAPLEQMASAANSFSKGDFTTRVPVEGFDEIGRLARAFNNMASALAVQDMSHRSFTANVSHELKTPMTTISGYIDGILDMTIPPEKHDYYLKIVSGEVKRLSRVVKSMLDISKIEAGEMTMHPVNADIHAIVCSVLFTFEKAIEDKGLEIRGLDVDKVFASCDPDLIHQVVFNLIENAVKFSEKDGYLEFGFKSADNMVFVSVKNSGAGLSREEKSKIFDRFYKSDTSRSLDKNGVGLGLHIVKSIVNLHSGEVIVNSEQGEYSEFVFSVPRAEQKKSSLFKKEKHRKPN